MNTALLQILAQAWLICATHTLSPTGLPGPRYEAGFESCPALVAAYNKIADRTDTRADEIQRQRDLHAIAKANAALATLDKEAAEAAEKAADLTDKQTGHN